MVRPSPLGAVPAEALVLHRVLVDVAAPTLVSVSADDSAGYAVAHALGSTLAAPDVSADSDGAHDVHVVLAHDADAAAAASSAAVNHAWVIAVHQEDPESRPWPGWHEEVVDAGYIPCQFTGTWRLYVEAARAETLGTALSYPAAVPGTDEPEDDLRADLIAWRSAALGRWADAAAQSRASDRTTVAQVDALRAEIDAIHHTVSWRLTRPLRAVQGVFRATRR